MLWTGQLVSQRIAPSVVEIDTKRTTTSAVEDESAFLYGDPVHHDVRRGARLQGDGLETDVAARFTEEIFALYIAVFSMGRRCKTS